MHKKLLLILIAFVAASISTVTFAFILTNITVPNSGIIKEGHIGVYWDSGCSNAVTAIDWGLLEASSTTDAIVYIRNEGTTSLTLSKGTDNWNPVAAENYITVSWDYAGEIVPSQIVPVTMTLSVSSNVQGITNFSFDITITGSG